MRIALLCPYSWTYPGGVTRHIEALAGELISAGNEVKVLAPFDPVDATSARLHRGALPEARERPDFLVPLGRTVGFPANGAVSNLAVFPEAIATLRAQLRSGRYDVAHMHEPVAPLLCWDALCSAAQLPLVGTFHTYSDNALTNGIARGLGATRRMNRLHARIAVSEAAAWTAQRFFGGRYRVIPNGVRIPEPALVGANAAPVAAEPAGERAASAPPLRILFIGQAVERKGLPVLLKAFEALRAHVPATLTLVGAAPQDVDSLLLDASGVTALGKVSEAQKLHALAEADLLCAPSLRGESFGMVLTEAFASGLPVVASDITGYRDVVRNGVDGILAPPEDPVALAEALRELAHSPARRAQMASCARERAERFAWPTVAAEVLDCYRDAIAVATRQRRRTPLAAPADGLPRVPPRRLPSLEPARERSLPRAALAIVSRGMLAGVAAGAVGLVLLVLQRIGIAAVLASIVGSKPVIVAGGFGLMCAAMLVRALAWHSILLRAPTWRPARLADALHGTFIGVLMSSTLPLRLGESSRALIVARRIGRARQTLPIVFGTMVSQSLLNLLALVALAVCGLLSIDLGAAHGVLIALTLAPIAALAVALLAPIVLTPDVRGGGRARAGQLILGVRVVLDRLRAGVALLRDPRRALIASVLQLSAWALQWFACWVLARALGLGLTGGVALGAAGAVLFAVNITAVVPATPGNVVVFQAACIAVLSGGYHVSAPAALAYGIVLQLVELLAAVAMGAPALMKEGLSWRELRLRTIHAVPVDLAPRAERELPAVAD